MQKIIYYKKDKPRAKSANIPSLMIDNNRNADTDDSYALQKSRVDYLKNEMRKCAKNRQIMKNNLPYIEQQLLDDEVALVTTKNSNKYLIQQLSQCKTHLKMLFAELNQVKKENIEKTNKIDYLEEHLQVYKQRNSALLSKIQKMQKYVDEPEMLETVPQKQLVQVVKENQLLKNQLSVEKSKSTQKQRSDSVTKPKLNKSTKKEIQREINEQLKTSNSNKTELQQVYKNQIQKILFQNQLQDQNKSDICYKNTEIIKWVNPLINCNNQLTRCEVPAQSVYLLRILAKKLNKQRQILDQDVIQNILTQLSNNIKIQMSDSPDRIYKCLSQLSQVAQFVIYDGSNLLKLLGLFIQYDQELLQFDTTNNQLSNIQRTQTIENLQNLMKNLQISYSQNYNQTEYFKSLDFYKKKDYIQLNEQQVQNMAFGVADSIWNYIKDYYQKNQQQCFYILKQHFENLLKQHSIHDQLEFMFQMLMRQDSIKLENIQTFALSENIQMIDFSLFYVIQTFLIMLNSYEVQLFEVFDTTKQMIIDRYQEFIRTDDLNNLQNDDRCCCYFPCFKNNDFVFKARLCLK